MDVKLELSESLQKLGKLQQKLAEKGASLEEQVDSLEKKIDEFAGELGKEPQASTRLELLAHLCLLSELASGMDFDRLVEAREKFRELLPEHFRHYLSHLEQSSWAISWSGCLDCRHFSGRCNLNLSPQEDPEDKYRLQKICSSYVKRSPKV